MEGEHQEDTSGHSEELPICYIEEVPYENLVQQGAITRVSTRKTQEPKAREKATSLQRKPQKWG